jgi:predicted dehydrogenase
MRAPLTLAIAGCGRVVERFHLPALRRSPEWRLVGACDPDAGRRRWVDEAWPGLAVWASAAELFDRAAADVVLVASPPAYHADLALRAMRSGLHVLVEKPMALDAEEAARLLEVSRDTGRRLWVSFNRRFVASYARLRRLLSRRTPEQVRDVRYHLTTDAGDWNTVSGYLGRDAQGGGVLDDIASHQIDLLGWLLDSAVARVLVTESPGGGGTHRMATCRLTLANGVEVCCEAGHGSAYREELSARLSGETLVADTRRLGRSRRLDAHRLAARNRLHALPGRVWQQCANRPDPIVRSFMAQYRALAAALSGGDGPAVAGAESGYRSVLAIEACRRSLRRGGEERVDSRTRAAP